MRRLSSPHSSNTKCMKNLKYIYAHKDYNKIKGLCKQVKVNKNLDIAAYILSKLIPNDCVVIPMPSHTGYATWSLKLANSLKLFRSDLCIFDCLYEVPNDGVCESKKHKIKVIPKIITKYGYVIPQKNVVLLDNVYDTGSTYNAAKVNTMTKLSILKHKIIRAYHNPKNWEYSRFKGYPENTYFGFESLKDYLEYEIKMFKNFYGKTLKNWRYD